MAEPRVEQWMREAAKQIVMLSMLTRDGEPIRTATEAIAAAYAPHDVERLLRELADELGDYVQLTVNPSSVQSMPELRWRDEETCDHRAVAANHIPAAVAEARRRMSE